MGDISSEAEYLGKHLDGRCMDEPMSFDVSARGESSNTAPSPSTRHGCKSLADTPYKGPNEMREKIIRYEATEAGASCLSRTPSISLAPPHLLWSTFLAPLPPLFPGTLSLPSSHLVPPCTPRRHVAAASYLVLLKGYFSRPLPLFLHSHRFTKGARNWGASWEECLEITDHLAVPLLSSSDYRSGGLISLLSLKQSRLLVGIEKDRWIFSIDCTIDRRCKSVVVW